MTIIEAIALRARRQLPPVFVQITEYEIRSGVGASEPAEVGDADLFAIGSKLAVGLLDICRRRHLQSKTIHRRQVLPGTSLQYNDVPRRRRMFYVLCHIEAGGDLQAQHFDIKAPASFDAI